MSNLTDKEILRILESDIYFALYKGASWDEINIAKAGLDRLREEFESRIKDV